MANWNIHLINFTLTSNCTNILALVGQKEDSAIHRIHVNIVRCVDSVWSALLQQGKMFFVFNILWALEKVTDALQNIIRLFLNIVNIFTMDWVTLQMPSKVLLTHLKCI